MKSILNQNLLSFQKIPRILNGDHKNKSGKIRYSKTKAYLIRIIFKHWQRVLRLFEPFLKS